MWYIISMLFIIIYMYAYVCIYIFMINAYLWYIYIFICLYMFIDKVYVGAGFYLSLIIYVCREWLMYSYSLSMRFCQYITIMINCLIYNHLSIAHEGQRPSALKCYKVGEV